MASRESQGLQVALILFVMMTVVLMVTTYVFYRKAEEKTNAAVAAATAKTSADQQRDKALFRVQVLKYMIGQGALNESQVQAQIQSDQEMAQLMADFEADMKMYGEGLPDAERNYRNLPRWIISAIQTKNVSVTDLTDKSNTLEVSLRDVTKAETDRTKVAVDGQKATAVELESERTKFNSAVAQFQTKMNESFEQVKKLGTQITQVQSKARTDVATATKTIQDQDQTIVSLQKKVTDAEAAQTPEMPDGKITLVNTDNSTVIIDLGRGDGMRIKTTFSVYDAGATDLKSARQKGRLEVIRVLDEATSLARIVDETSVRDPILADDVIFSPVWRPGRKMRFAMAGLMHINEDNQPDNNYIENVITINGGVIDAKLSAEGVATGRMTDQTQYLVLGDRPDETTPEAYRKEFGRMTEDAARRGIQEISVDDLLKLMGWKPELRRVSLGKGSRAGADGTGEFRPRRPPGAAGAPAAGDSAF